MGTTKTSQCHASTWDHWGTHLCKSLQLFHKEFFLRPFGICRGRNMPRITPRVPVGETCPQERNFIDVVSGDVPSAQPYPPAPNGAEPAVGAAGHQKNHEKGKTYPVNTESRPNRHAVSISTIISVVRTFGAVHYWCCLNCFLWDFQNSYDKHGLGSSRKWWRKWCTRSVDGFGSFRAAGIDAKIWIDVNLKTKKRRFL